MAGQRSALGTGVEFDLIRRFLAEADADAGNASPDPHVLVGPGDDCAVIDAGRFAISVDLAVEDVHFRRAWIEPDEIGYRAAAVALSDLAAMAATPLGILVSLAVRADEHATLAPAVLRGAREAARTVGARVIGGDVTRAPERMVIDVVVIGRVAEPVLRSGARVGDELWVTGRLGAAAAAVAAWRANATPPADARAAFARPSPRIAEALWLREHDVLNAMLDVSDGIAGDAGHLAAASGVAIAIDVDRVPVHPAADLDLAHDLAHDLALGGGDDYELLFAAPPGLVQSLVSEFSARFDVALTCIGNVEAGQGARFRRNGEPYELARGGYDHFGGPSHKDRT